MTRATLIVIGLSVLVHACGEPPVVPRRAPDPEPSPRDPLIVEVNVAPTALSPGSSANITSQARPPTGREIETFSLRLTGLLDTLVPIPVTGSGTQFIELTLSVPRIRIEGEITFTALATTSSGDADSASQILSIGDQRPPTAGFTSLPNPEPGWNHSYGFRASDDVGLMTLEFQAAGAGTGGMMVTLDTVPNLETFFWVQVAESAAVGDTVYLRAILTDLFDKVTQLDEVIFVTERQAPTIRVRLDSLSATRPPEHGPTLAANDSAFITVIVEDNYQLGRWGYQSRSDGAATDTLPLVGMFDSLNTIVIPLDWRVGEHRVEYFVFDSVGNRASAFQAIRLEVMPAVRIPYSELPFVETGAAGPVVEDIKRNRVYWARWDASELLVVDLNTFTIVDRLALPNLIRSLDLTSSNDSLLVVLIDTHDFGVVDLESSSLVLETMAFASPPEVIPWGVKVGVDGRAYVTVDSVGPTEPLVNYVVDLASGVTTMHTMFAVRSPLVRSFDRSVIVASLREHLTRLDVASGDLRTIPPLSDVYFPEVGLDSTGARMIVHDGRPALYTRDLVKWQQFNVPQGTWAHISLDGGSAYALGYRGYIDILPVLGGVDRTNVAMPFITDWMVPLTNQRLLVLAPTGAALIEMPD